MTLPGRRRHQRRSGPKTQKPTSSPPTTPAYVLHLDESLHQIGRTRKDVRALALTHGHIDHIGMAAALAELGAGIYLHPADPHLAAHWLLRD
ncbi:MAG TPA: MBL fold metallo-hydrolase [Streptosporangiaceae bacterium]|nr:MBL fold metallo-hydrolase [Streptosporangiaceae bacterium]